MSDTPTGLEESDQQRYEEAQQLLASPPEMSMHPTDSFWSHFISPYDDSRLETTSLSTDPYDIVIIGGGLTGVSVAYWLTELGVKGDSILLLEGRDALGAGATGRNGGHCWPSTRVWPEKVVKHWGEESMLKGEVWKYESAAMFMDWLETNRIDCEFTRTGSCNLAAFDEEMGEYAEYMAEKKPREEALKTVMELWDEKRVEETLPCAPHKWKGGIYQSLAGQFWPRKAVRGIAQLSLERGVTMRTKTIVKSITRTASAPLVLDTSAGPVFCHKVIHATNGYATNLLPQFKGVLLPVRGQVIATSPISSFLLPNSLSFNDGYEYLIHRRVDKRIIYGGMRWRAQSAGKEVAVSDDSKIDPNVSEGLRTSLLDIFPALKDEPGFHIDYEWTGIMGYTCDNYPLIGALNDAQNEWIAAGYSGNGMPQCFGAAKAVSEMMVGRLARGRDWIPHFDPRRFENDAYAAKWRYTGAKPLKSEE